VSRSAYTLRGELYERGCHYSLDELPHCEISPHCSFSVRRNSAGAAVRLPIPSELLRDPVSHTSRADDPGRRIRIPVAAGARSVASISCSVSIAWSNAGQVNRQT